MSYLELDGFVRFPYLPMQNFEPKHAGEITPPSPIDATSILEHSVSESEEGWRMQVLQRADRLTTDFYETLLDRPANADELALAATCLAKAGGINSVLAQLVGSDEFWTRQLRAHANTTAQSIASSFTGAELDGQTIADLMVSLEGLGDFRALCDGLKDLPQFERAMFGRYAMRIVVQLHRSLAQREPTQAELSHFTNFLTDVQQVEAVATAIAVRAGGTENVPASMASPSRVVGAIPLDAAGGADGELVMVDGFHRPETNFSWSTQDSTISVNGEVCIYLACNYLEPGQQRTIEVTDGSQRQSIVICDQYSFHELKLPASGCRTISFRADGFRNPKRAGQSEDDRDLSFQLCLRVPPDAFIVGKTDVPVLIFVGDDKKEIDSLMPVYKKMLTDGCSVRFLSIDTAIAATRENYSLVAGYVIAMGGAYDRLNAAGCRGSFIYLEHGVSPVKRYTYGAHYLRYDLSLLPGHTWTERLEHLFPRIKGRCRVIGYPKLNGGSASSEAQRVALCARLGLDPGKPVVMFAPTWSGGDEGSGIFNLKYFDVTENLLVIPHDGDVEFSKQFADAGYRIHRPGLNESISDYYGLADILVSDVSSTAIEFAFLGKPVVCLELARIPDFDPQFIEPDGRLRIPHTSDYWDFCEWVRPESIMETLSVMKNQGSENAVLIKRRERVRRIVESFGAESINTAVGLIEEFFKRKSAVLFSGGM